MHVNRCIKFNNVTRKTHQLKGKPENITLFQKDKIVRLEIVRNLDSLRTGSGGVIKRSDLQAMKFIYVGLENFKSDVYDLPEVVQKHISTYVKIHLFTSKYL